MNKSPTAPTSNAGFGPGPNSRRPEPARRRDIQQVILWLLAPHTHRTRWPSRRHHTYNHGVLAVAAAHAQHPRGIKTCACDETSSLPRPGANRKGGLG